ncbi:unnamed protein product [Boreogadus saida]
MKSLYGRTMNNKSVLRELSIKQEHQPGGGKRGRESGSQWECVCVHTRARSSCTSSFFSSSATFKYLACHSSTRWLRAAVPHEGEVGQATLVCMHAQPSHC